MKKIKHIEIKKIPVKVGFKLKDGGIVYFKATKVVRVKELSSHNEPKAKE